MSLRVLPAQPALPGPARSVTPCRRVSVGTRSVCSQLPQRQTLQSPACLQSKVGYGSMLVPVAPVRSATPMSRVRTVSKQSQASPDNGILGCSVSTAASSDYAAGFSRSRASTSDQSDFCISPDRMSPEFVFRSHASTPEAAASADAHANGLWRSTHECIPKAGAYTLQGTKGQHNQDTYLVLPLGDTRVLVGVFDGHGHYGHVAAARTRDMFAQMACHLIPKAPAPFSDEAAEGTLRKLFEIVHAALIREPDSNGQLMAAYSGTTATAAVIDTQRGTMTCAHVGDSSLKMSCNGAVHFQTRDHVVDEAAEQRVLMHGGEVYEAVIAGINARRIFAKGSGVPAIMMDRSLGDVVGHHLGMLSTPEVSTGVRVGCGSVIILASDGVWEHQATQQVFTHAGHSDPQRSAKNVVEQARAGCACNPLIDDITAVVVTVEPKHLGRLR